jgi:hypothetical protein
MSGNEGYNSNSRSSCDISNNSSNDDNNTKSISRHGDAEDNVKQGALGEFFSKDGRDFYTDGELDGVGQSGREHGEQTQTFARPGDHPGGHESFPLDGAGGGLNSLGENFAFYGSGTCHARTPPCE